MFSASRYLSLSRGSVSRGVAASAVAGLLAATPAAAEDVKALYDVTFAGFRIAQGTLGIKLKGSAYAAKVQITTSGLARIISSEESEASSRGQLLASRASPASYELFSRGEKITQVDMSLSGSEVRKLRAIRNCPKRTTGCRSPRPASATWSTR
ncbi:DUF3108 domain-containing protein [Methylobrevis pamukkalensis]|uniref:DUF3108 domain-containing protein n=1 Tax=Methylobrevis pamukkalensis TaxID=1439726 RepID=A0A1E3H0Q7_9HYPH|nr:DUF3108 domain-containing protein [Methylobrevis pamukkalensis]ODN69872.1 hypothetical protein A6302_02807 [Methylobrevis pamukkalensis]